ncbi:glycerol-3-phosphate 1-O-acyltransferase PlsY [Polaromonas sp. A23]|uniref:glycerol-3-phosphate 1-O-acyltransferase PlsY n=1 Tax=Polaromonas sp. A23 TaxID=1944133 RepID=UPI00098624F3|nr:glycerol-3-phosphate 1-O-acyltransferase PlsY [Polaromonas sp. A23]OOG36651.1 glycerol-3-phosphate acyltransferase [Polaromonas sp. A23]
MVYVYPVLAVLAAYLIGSLSFAVIVSKLMGLNDPRSYGSKNPGATNVLRSGNKAAAALTLLFDGVKGWVPMALVMWFGKDYGLREGTLAAVGLAAFMGHLYPVFFGFKGGKGVATAAGVLFGVHWILGLATLATWIIVAFFSRYSSLAALACAIFAPWYYLIGDRSFWYVDKLVALALVAMSAFLIFRHRENIIKLLKGTESKLGGKKKS